MRRPVRGGVRRRRLQVLPVLAALVLGSAPASGAEERIDGTILDTPPKEWEDEGAYLNILSFDRSFQGLLRTCFPGYAEDEDGRASIGGVTVRFFQTPEDDGRYEDRLDAQLPVNALTEPEDRIDLFLLTDKELRKYCQTELARPFEELGIAEEELPEGFAWADLDVRDAEGRRRAAAVLLSPGFLVYRREAAELVLGSAEPWRVQAAAESWEVLEQTAEIAGKCGIPLFSSYEELFPLFASVKSEAWSTDDGAETPVITVPSGLRVWAELCADWQKRGFFGTETEPLFMTEEPSSGGAAEQLTEEAAFGLVRGPAVWHRPSLYLLCAADTDNPGLAAELIRSFCADERSMRTAAAGSGLFTDTAGGMRELAEGYYSSVYGGQNNLSLMLGMAEELSCEVNRSTVWDQALDRLYSETMKEYIEGGCTFSEAEAVFYEQAERLLW